MQSLLAFMPVVNTGHLALSLALLRNAAPVVGVNINGRLNGAEYACISAVASVEVRGVRAGPE